MAALRTAVRVVEVVALLASLAFVVLLFANEPSTSSVPAASSGDPVDGAAVYASRCSTCHGDDGDGGRGPTLGGGVVAAEFPDPADQVAVVTNGRGTMPSFRTRLTPEEIAAVVEYTREDL